MRPECYTFDKVVVVRPTATIEKAELLLHDPGPSGAIVLDDARGGGPAE